MDVFSRIYRANLWNGVETRSGPGSGYTATRHMREEVSRLIRDLDITSVVDAACGEAYWQPEMPEYLGLDVSLEAIRAARLNHPTWRFKRHDIRHGCPKADLVICRDAIQHMSLADGFAAVDAIIQSGSRYMLVSTYFGGNTTDIRTGGYHEPDLMQPPWSMPHPDRVIFDGYSYHDPDEVRDPRKYLGLWAIA